MPDIRVGHASRVRLQAEKERRIEVYAVWDRKDAY